jgi:hypothetical protein
MNYETFILFNIKKTLDLLILGLFNKSNENMGINCLANPFRMTDEN